MALDPKAAPPGAAAVDWRARAERFELALRTIAKRQGRFSIDHAEHAWNTIVDMSAVAVDALKHENLPIDPEWEARDAE